MLQRGSWGDAVVLLQQALNQGNSNLAPLDEDGAFGSLTHNRVCEFQSDNSLVPDGVVGPQTYGALDPLIQLLNNLGQGLLWFAAKARKRQDIVNRANALFNTYQWDIYDTPNPANPSIAGKLCADQATRLRQGGAMIATIFTTGGVDASRCLTISPPAEAMYTGDYTAQDRNNLDIPSWCGLFALYVYKTVGLQMSPWPLRSRPNFKDDALELATLPPGARPQMGDIGVVDPVSTDDRTAQNHHFIITGVNGGIVSSVDGNAGNLMEIVQSKRSIWDIRASGGYFLSPIWERVLLTD
jgi:peptidoglycan hydrolase-like protein with peptidoglycan-binding domain